MMDARTRIHIALQEDDLAAVLESSSMHDMPATDLLCEAARGGRLLLCHLAVRYLGAETSGEALREAALEGHTDVLRYLIRENADVNASGSDGCTALHLAASKGEMVTVTELLASRASPELCMSVDGEEITPAHMAKMANHHSTAFVIQRNMQGTQDPLSQAGKILRARLPSIPDSPVVLPLSLPSFYIQFAQGACGYLLVGCLLCILTPKSMAIASILYYIIGHRLLRFGSPEKSTRSQAEARIAAGRSLVIVGIFHSSVATALLTWSLCIPTPASSLAIVAALSAMLMAVYWGAWRRDPNEGQTRAACSQEQYIELLRKGMQHHEFCTTCGVVRVARSKHCDCCGRCIMGFDHHCPGIGNCVGQGNRVLFVVLLGLLTMLQVAFIQQCASYLDLRLGVVVSWVGHLSQSTTVLEQGAVPLCSRLVAVQLMYQTLAVLILGALAGIQVYLVSVNLTTNEFVNWRKYGMTDAEGRFYNPYHKGFMKNWLSLFSKDSNGMIGVHAEEEALLEMQHSNGAHACSAGKEGAPEGQGPHDLL